MLLEVGSRKLEFQSDFKFLEKWKITYFVCGVFHLTAALTVTAELSKAGAFNFIAQLCKLSSAVFYNFKKRCKNWKKIQDWANNFDHRRPGDVQSLIDIDFVHKKKGL